MISCTVDGTFFYSLGFSYCMVVVLYEKISPNFTWLVSSDRSRDYTHGFGKA
jgi:hypothetical protein